MKHLDVWNIVFWLMVGCALIFKLVRCVEAGWPGVKRLGVWNIAFWLMVGCVLIFKLVRCVEAG